MVDQFVVQYISSDPWDHPPRILLQRRRLCVAMLGQNVNDGGRFHYIWSESKTIVTLYIETAIPLILYAHIGYIVTFQYVLAECGTAILAEESPCCRPSFFLQPRKLDIFITVFGVSPGCTSDHCLIVSFSVVSAADFCFLS